MTESSQPQPEVAENRIAAAVFRAALAIHQSLGPGLFESVYEAILAHELRKSGHKVEAQVQVPLVWDGISFEKAFRADLIVDGLVLVEIKATAELPRVAAKQVATYLRLTGLRLGLLVNFGAELLKHGFQRVANGLPDER